MLIAIEGGKKKNKRYKHENLDWMGQYFILLFRIKDIVITFLNSLSL
jgi:hypothetical protein